MKQKHHHSKQETKPFWHVVSCEGGDKVHIVGASVVFYIKQTYKHFFKYSLEFRGMS